MRSLAGELAPITDAAGRTDPAEAKVLACCAVSAAGTMHCARGSRNLMRGHRDPGGTAIPISVGHRAEELVAGMSDLADPALRRLGAVTGTTGHSATRAGSRT